MSFKLDQSSLIELLKVPTYRDFIRQFIKERAKIKKLSYSDIARHGGFATRSFPRDVVLGTKRLTPSSLPKFIKGLGLSSDLADYFRVLVEIEESDCRLKSFDETKLHQIKENLKKRILLKSHVNIGQTDKAFVLSYIPKVYAALGDLNVGADLREISEKTSLSESEIIKALEYMTENDLVFKKGRRFIAKELHANFQGLKSEIFKNHFIITAETSAQVSRKYIGENFFLVESQSRPL